MVKSIILFSFSLERDIIGRNGNKILFMSAEADYDESVTLSSKFLRRSVLTSVFIPVDHHYKIALYVMISLLIMLIVNQRYKL